MKRAVIALSALIPVTVAAVLVGFHVAGGNISALWPFGRSRAHVAAPVSGCRAPSPADRYVGAVVYKPQHVNLPAFVSLTGVHPSILEYYVEFGQTLDLARAAEIYRNSAFPIVQVDPYHSALSAIASGHYDSYLRAQAAAVKDFRCPIAISFGHEMNGNWYDWGGGHVAPAVFVAAWRRIHDVFTAAGARNVVWLWTVNRVSGSAPLLKAWWPGAGYVDWVGLDGYYRKAKSTFTSLFSTTLQDLRAFTSKPVLLTETAVTRLGAQEAMIANLFQGARRSGVFAVVWFDVNALQRWELAGRPKAVVTAFHREAVWYTH